MITLLDYGAGNVRSVINAIESLGEAVKVASGPGDIAGAEKLVFPGVGNFGNMMGVLREKGFVSTLLEYLHSGKPFLGICLGLQALFEKSEEAPGAEGLGFFAGIVKRFDVPLSVPHIGWNGILIRKESSVFNSLRGDEKFYFVHSYHVVPEDQDIILTTTSYGIDFVSSVEKGNVTATQFHPEKSGGPGLTVLKNFIKPGSAFSAPLSGKAGKTSIARRIVACLDVRSNDAGELVVTKGDQYDVRDLGEVRNLGNPVELAERYYEEGADEIAFLNITGFRDFPLKDLPGLELLKQTCRRVFVPLTIGGGIRDYTDQAGRTWSAEEVAAEYFRSGADKVSLGSDAVMIVEDYLASGRRSGASAIEKISALYGSQAVVISIDPRRVYADSRGRGDRNIIETSEPGPGGERFCWFQCTINGGREGRPVDAVTLARTCEELGAGEILLNSIDRDGTGKGFDIELINAVRESVSIPVIASSGAGSESHFLDLFTATGAEAALAAGIFHRRELSIPAVKKYLADFVEIRAEHGGKA